MNVQELQTRADWEAVAASLPVSFLQSWEWGEMQQAAGHPVLRLRLDDSVLTVIALELAFSRTVLFAPRGPVSAPGLVMSEATLQQLAASDVLKKFARDQRAIALRLEPLEVASSSALRTVHDVSPSTTSVLDLTSSLEDLLSGMKSKTRYNVKLAQRQGVAVQFFSSLSSANTPDWMQLAEDWWELVTETSQRHGIGSHKKNYYAQLISSLGQSGLLEVVQARLDGELLAMNLNCTYRGMTTYVHGAATHRRKEVMASYALQWASIQRAKAAGSLVYDFYGIATPGQAQHPLAGVTRFKQGFGGTIVTTPGTVELALNRPWYTIYSVIRRLRG